MPEQTNPKHYTTANGKNLFRLMEEGLLTPDQYTDFLVGNITKYIHLEEQKNGAEDLAKAGAYLTTLGVKLYGVDFGPLLLEAVGAQLDKHAQPTTLVDEADFIKDRVRTLGAFVKDHTDTPNDLDQSTLGVIATLNDEDLVTLADAATFSVSNDLKDYRKYYVELTGEQQSVIDALFCNATSQEDYEDLKKYAGIITKRLSGINTQALEAAPDHTEQPADTVLARLTHEAYADDFEAVKALYIEMLEAGIKDRKEARDFLIAYDDKEVKDALLNLFHNLEYSSDWDDMVKYFGPLVTAQCQAEADTDAKEVTEAKPELNSKLNPVEVSALKKAYRDIIELDGFNDRANYFQANSSWLGVPLAWAFNNDGYREDVADLLNWGFHNVSTGLPVTKSQRTEDAKDLKLLNRAYHLVIFSYTKEERAKAIRESSEKDFSWDQSRKVAYITSDLLGDNISDKISEDVITYFIDNPDQATYK